MGLWEHRKSNFKTSHEALLERSVTGWDGSLVFLRSVPQHGRGQSSGQGEGRTRKSLSERVAWTWSISALGIVVCRELACKRRLWKA